MSPVYVYVFNLALVLLLVFANAFFVVSEFAIVKIRRTKLEELAHFGNKRAKIALKITENLNTYLSAIQLGITLASLGLGWIGEPAVSHLLEDLFGHYFADNKVLLHSVSAGHSEHRNLCACHCQTALCLQTYFFAVHLGF